LYLFPSLNVFVFVTSASEKKQLVMYESVEICLTSWVLEIP